MDYVLLTYILISIGLATFISTIVIKKKIAFIYCLYLFLFIILTLINLLDKEYYNSLFLGITRKDYFIFLFTLLFTIICIIESLLKKKKHHSLNYPIDINQIFSCFDQMNTDFAVLDEESGRYIINNHLQVSLGIDKSYLDKEEINELKYEEDKTSSAFRLLINNVYQWFEENSIKVNDGIFRIIYRNCTFLGSNAVTGIYKDLEHDISDLLKEKIEFGLIFTSITSIKEISNDIEREVKEKEFRDTIISKYISKLLSGDFKDYIKAYYLSNNDFAYLITNKRIIEMIEKGLRQNASPLICYAFEITNVEVEIRTKLGLVKSSDVNPDVNSVINTTFSLLNIVKSKNFNEDYLIYHKKLQENDQERNQKEVFIASKTNKKRNYQ